MNEYIMLLRVMPQDRSHRARVHRNNLAERIAERTLSVPGASIERIRLTLGQYDAILDVRANTHNDAFDLATSIQEATPVFIETLPVATSDRDEPASPPGDPDDPAGVREPSPTAPSAMDDSAEAQRPTREYNTVADVMNAPEPSTTRRRTRAVPS